ncbi:MAG: sulfotransferase [Deltaproteobacteria bacterium]|jgi:hypothetical protein|nr:sulfotransferase [Deltaproteobacteria bacterium]
MEFEIGELEQEARERVGLEDFGGEEWREPLRRLLDSVQSEAELTPIGRGMVRGLIVDRLVNRLEIQDWVARHPEVMEERVEAPIVLATLPRTGQTAAGWIFDRDPANRSLLTWFVKRPCPPPRPGQNEGDPRLERERAMVAAMPSELLELHLYDAEEPDECHWLISNAFRTPHEIYSMRVPAYYRWVRDDPGIRAAYAYYRLQLQILQSRTRGRRWVLKNSPHLLYLEAFHEVLPDAIYVQFHRDPLKVLASNCRLAVLLRGMASDRVDASEVGASMLELLRDYLEGLMRFREKGLSRPWIDVRFSEFVADPLREIEGVYEKAGLAMTDETRAAMAAWVEAHPRQDLTRARPADLRPYGIDPDAAREVFREYVEAFGVDDDGI